MTGPITLFVCGTPESAPAWWSPDSEISAMEAGWIEAMSQEQGERWRELEAAEDRAARLLDGSCDVCQEPSSLPLIEVAGEALCAGCLEASGISYPDAAEQAPAPITTLVG